MENNAYWEECQQLIAELPKNITVKYAGELPHHELEKLIVAHHAFILPTRGENFGHAIFESLSAGCPVLISDQTPWNGLEQANAGWALPLLKQDLFTSKIQEVCRMDEKEYNEVSLAAYSFAHA